MITDRRRQNPHMHLFEATLALCEVGDGDPADLALATELWRLAEAYFFTPAGVVEFFDDALIPLPGDAGRTLEPGHGFEWAWLAGRWAVIGGANTSAWVEQLYGAGRRGVGPLGMACDEIWPDGTIKTATARCWPQTEWLKAALTRFELGHAGALEDVGQAYAALMTYRDGLSAGLWRDRRLENGDWQTGGSPASTGYHIVCALNALLQAASTDHPAAHQ